LPVATATVKRSFLTVNQPILYIKRYPLLPGHTLLSVDAAGSERPRVRDTELREKVRAGIFQWVT